MTPRVRHPLAAAVPALALGLAHARQPPAPAPFEPITRTSLAQRYLAVDALFMRLANAPRPASPDRRRDINRRFDAVTLAFFAGNLAGAAAALDELRSRIAEPSGEPLPTRGAPISISCEPPAWWPGNPERPAVLIRSTGPLSLPHGAEVPLELTIENSPSGSPITARVGDSGELVCRVDLADAAGAGDPSALAGGRLRLAARITGTRDAADGAVTIASRSLDAARVINAERLAAFSPDSPLAPSVWLCAARNDLLNDRPLVNDPTLSTTDLAALSDFVDAELGALERADDPYARVAGTFFRPFLAGAARIRCWIHVPHTDSPRTPRPLVVALHGAGGDERMFIDGYGAGELVRLADDRGFVVASPAAYQLVGNGRAFDALLDAVRAHAAIDPSRVYVIGHSMGASGAASIARVRRASVAGAVCFSGGGSISAVRDPIAPTLVIAGALDAVVPAPALRAEVERCAAAGLPVEYRERPDDGHTLVVGPALAEAVDWLLAHRLEPERR